MRFCFFSSIGLIALTTTLPFSSDNVMSHIEVPELIHFHSYNLPGWFLAYLFSNLPLPGLYNSIRIPLKTSCLLVPGHRLWKLVFSIRGQQRRSPFTYLLTVTFTWRHQYSICFGSLLLCLVVCSSAKWKRLALSLRSVFCIYSSSFQTGKEG